MRNRLEWVQNADWRCIALPGSLPLSGPVCLDFLLRALLVQKLGHCQFIKAASDTAMQPSPCAHTLCSSCLHHLPRRSLSSYSTSLSPSTDHLSITRPRLLICPPSVSRYRTPSTYSGYTFIHLPQSPCSLDVPGLDIQPIVNDLFTVTSSFSATQSTPPSVLSFCTYPPHRPPPHPLTPFFQKPCFVPFISRGKMLHIVNFSHCTTPRRIGFQRQTLCLNCSGN